MRIGFVLLGVGLLPLLAQSAPEYPDKAQLLVFKDDQGQAKPIATTDHWARRRADIVANMETVMGMLPAKKPVRIVYLEEEKTAHFTRKKLTFRPEGYEPVTAYLFIPAAPKGKVPAVLCLHPTNGALGAKSSAGLGGKESVFYALHLAERGYVTLAPDYPSFGEYSYDFKKSPFLSGSMKAIWNNMRALDFLQTLPEVDAQKIGAIGHSLGGHNAIFTAVFDTRIQATVSNCGFTSFPKYYEGKLKGWTSDRYMPRIATLFDLDPARVPFDFPEVIAALAPRAFLASSPLHDANFEVSGVRDCLAAARPVYDLFGASDKLAANYPDCAHDFPPDARKVAYEFLDRWLK